MMMRIPATSSSPMRSSLQSFASNAFVLCSWAFFVGVVSGFTTCPIACTNNGFGNVFIDEDDDNRYGAGRVLRVGYNRMSMSRGDVFESNENSVGPIHHTAVKTRNITMAIKFYSLLGFEPTAKFKAGPARAAWLEQQSTSPTTIDTTKNSTAVSRIELIEVPPWILKEPVGMTRRAIDLFENQEYLGHNHLALDVTSSIDANKTDLESSLLLRNHTFLLSAWMETLNEKSLQLFRKTLRVALEAEQFMVGNVVYERAFIYDADGALIELLHRAAELPQHIDPMSGWELYDWFEDGNETDARNDDKVDFSNN